MPDLSFPSTHMLPRQVVAGQELIDSWRRSPGRNRGWGADLSASSWSSTVTAGRRAELREGPARPHGILSGALQPRPQGRAPGRARAAIAVQIACLRGGSGPRVLGWSLGCASRRRLEGTVRAILAAATHSIRVHHSRVRPCPLPHCQARSDLSEPHIVALVTGRPPPAFVEVRGRRHDRCLGATERSPCARGEPRR